MESDELTQCTQGVLDPRRLGRNNSGLSVEDISDVMCILHPCTPAAFKLVAETARRVPQHILQTNNYPEFEPDATPSMIENQETFILPKGTPEDNPNPPMDLALRFSTKTINPVFGFIFGRNKDLCDIVVPTDTHKRISNVHFSISMNNSGVLMLSDMSTNGTMVDDILLKGKKDDGKRTRMLNPGSIIQILSLTPEESLKFIVRIPSREGHFEEYESKFQAYMQRVLHAQAKFAPPRDKPLLTTDPNGRLQPPPRPNSVAVKAPILHNQYGMHWSGGDHYNVVGQIGKGAFASVYQLATKSDGQLFAAKELEKRRFMKSGILDRKLDNEMHIMKSINHPNVVQYVDYQDVANHLYIIMEFVACGDLQQYLNGNGALSEDVGSRMASQVFGALAYLHDQKITHRDIKPDNILIADLDPQNFTVKLSDFGLSKVVKDNDTFLKTFCGTLLYCAPEVFPEYEEAGGKGTKRPRKGISQPPVKFHSYSQSVDIWSFGAVLWYSLCFKPPFEGVAGGHNGSAMFNKIMTTPLDTTDLVQQGISTHAIALLTSMLITDPAARPSALSCLHSAWFGHILDQTAQYALPGLNPITEEVEGEAASEPDVGSLSLDELQSSANSEVSLNSADMNFFDPRQSKRFKSNAMEYRDHSSLMDSSSELMYQSIPIVNDIMVPSPSSAGSKLFGEISRSDLQSPVFNKRANEAVGHPPGLDGSGDLNVPSDGKQSMPKSPLRNVQASPSLLGAESLVRELHMADSPFSNGSQGTGANDPKTPNTPDNPNGAAEENKSDQQTPAANVDVTPKPAQPPKMNRQINIAIPPSFWWDPDDPSTHTVEYASKVSGRDFASYSSYPAKDESLPATTNGSAVDNDFDKTPEEPAALILTGHGISDQPTDPSKSLPRYGRLISTRDSHDQICLDLNTRVTSWGRGPENTYIYPDKSETRVPKTGIVIFFHAHGIDKLAESDDWTHLPGLYCGILTHSSYGLFVNGVPLPKGEPGKQSYGRVHSGDEIVVWHPGRDGKLGMKFICEIYCGEGKLPRGGDSSNAPPGFTVVTVDDDVAPPSSASATSSVGNNKGKRKMKENVVLGVENMTPA